MKPWMKSVEIGESNKHFCALYRLQLWPSLYSLNTLVISSRVIHQESSIESCPLRVDHRELSIESRPSRAVHREPSIESRPLRVVLQKFSVESLPSRVIRRESSILESSRVVYRESSIAAVWRSWHGGGNRGTPRSRAMEPFRQDSC